MADYPLRKNVGRGLAGLSRATNRNIDPREVQAMFADVASGLGVPFTDAGAKYLRGDVEGAKESAAIEGALSAIPAAALAAKPVYRAAKRAVPQALETTRRMAEEAIEHGTPMGQMLEASGPSYIVKPQGNINLAPATSAESLRGPERQTVGDFLKQIRGNPGVTKESFERIAERYSDPTQRLTKAEFETQVPPSKYSIEPIRAEDSMGQTEEALLEQAADLLDQGDDLWHAVGNDLGVGLREESLNDLWSLYTGRASLGDVSPDVARAISKNFKGLPPERMQAAFIDSVDEQRRDLVHRYASELAENADYGPAEDFRDIQRLTRYGDPSYDTGYFMRGVTHPDVQPFEYRHFPSFYSESGGLIGHIRGTRFGEEGGDIQYFEPGKEMGKQEFYRTKPNSVVLEELQSDAQKHKEQTGPLSKAHAVLFKGAVEDALRGGADAVYYPTARIIAPLRQRPAEKFAPIYDEEIMRYGLEPLRKIKGVEIKEVDPSEFGPAYYEINFSPEAKEHILEGPGQLLPGYAEGGSVTRPASSGFNFEHISILADAL